MCAEKTREIGVREAKSLLKRRQRVGRGSRVHDETFESNANRLRALEGMCGQCPHIKPESVHMGNGTGVSLRCRKGRSPLDLYRATSLGQDPVCPGFPSED